MRIIKGTEPRGKANPLMVISGPPGIGKSTLSFGWNGLNLDFDEGTHRAENRRDVCAIESWDDAIYTRTSFDGYDGVAIDTAERALGKLTPVVLEESSRFGANGQLYPNGHARRTRMFIDWLDGISALGKDVLVLAHVKEDRIGNAGDERLRVKADIPPATQAELLKRADFVGFLYYRGGDRVLDFNPTDQRVAKNPAGWPAMKLPAPHEMGSFLADLFASGRAALLEKSKASAAIAREVEMWRDIIATLRGASAPEWNALIPRLASLDDVVRPQVKRLLWEASKAAGLSFSVDGGCFLDPLPGRPAVVPPTTRPAGSSRPATWQPQLISKLSEVR